MVACGMSGLFGGRRVVAACFVFGFASIWILPVFDFDAVALGVFVCFVDGFFAVVFVVVLVFAMFISLKKSCRRRRAYGGKC
jgi:hypothetical protein